MTTLGYTTIGSSNTFSNNDRLNGCEFTLTETAVVQSITAYVNTIGVTRRIKGVLVNTSLGIISGGVTDPSPLGSNGLQWLTASFTTLPTLSPGDYFITWITDDTSFQLYYDDLGNTGLSDTTNSYTTPTDPTDATTGFTRTYSLYATYTAGTPAGYPVVGVSQAGGSSGANNFPGLMITMPVAGSITKITAYVGNTVSSTNSTCKLYAGSAGTIGALLATTNTATVTTTFQWVEFTFATPFAASETTYWLEFDCDGGNGPGGNIGSVNYNTGGAANTGYQRNDFNVPVYNTNQYSIFASYTPMPFWTIYVSA